MAKKMGQLVSIEGVEGAGKSTLAQFLVDYLQHLGVPVLLTREPGGTPLAEEIRHLVLREHTEKLWPKTEALLMFASRLQHLENKILPALEAGTWVISDRFVDASYAYQGAGRALGFASIQALHHWSMPTYAPALTFLLDIPLQLSAERLQQRTHRDRIEQEQHDFFERIRAMYSVLAAKEPQRFCVLDATQEKSVVQRMAQHRLHTVLQDAGIAVPHVLV